MAVDRRGRSRKPKAMGNLEAIGCLVMLLVIWLVLSAVYVSVTHAW